MGVSRFTPFILLVTHSLRQAIIKTIDNCKISRYFPSLGVALGVVLGLVGISFDWSLVPVFLELSERLGIELFLNTFYFGLALIFSAIVLSGYPLSPPHRLVDLYWAAVLILFASFLLGLYHTQLEGLDDMKDLKPHDEAIRIRLKENLNVLFWVAPAVMLAVAANLITQFLNASLENNKAKMLLKRNRRENKYKIR